MTARRSSAPPRRGAPSAPAGSRSKRSHPTRQSRTSNRLRDRPLREDLVTQACLEVYGAVRHEGRMADRALEHVLRTKKHMYSNERRAVAERVYALLRSQRLVDYLASRSFIGFGATATTRQDLLRLAVSRVLEGEAVVAVAQDLSPPEGQALSSLAHFRRGLGELPEAQRLAIETSLPDFFAQKLVAELGDDARAAAEAMNVRAPLCVRVNTLKSTREEVSQTLAAQDVPNRPTPLSPLGLILETRKNVYTLDAFRNGLFDVQDEGSQLLGMLVDAPPRRVIDACAGAGGKTLQLAAQMKNKGELFALDVDERRLDDLRQRTRRAGVHNTRVELLPEDEAAEAVLEKYKDSAERVLVDAPCSGSGTYRRKPDARYKLDEAMLADHVSRQKVLLERFSKLVKPNGRLIYGTCSVLRDENEDVVSDFLSRHPEFSVAPAAKWLGDELAQKITRDGMLRLFSHRHGTDGFFGAVLLRRPA